ncbi:AP2/ERF and B3 domain-containing protein Os01g0141000-like [Panicum virgatum]|uniref:AP2/ERF and B3 domain-containing protein Os01g0141000-like n=1 Tax=Panicum virgatum TaxID=38727 RepID=UPI0019D5E11C|nr:AP2/ERF and B3 domain-containing protein Os01g0141000-like [Panicum virgatum]
MLRLHMSTGNDARLSPRQGGRAAPPCAREHLFQKALTPSDVGNLNRLVVPKQHAEKHLFVKRSPLMAAGMGVLLDVKDGEGRTWRFRYSYCRISRIYWRRFVWEKGLHAGDTVAFSRSAIGPFKQMHIDYWKKKKEDVTADDAIAAVNSPVVMLFGVDIARRGSPELRSS